jgi:predicted trehalose synthase
MDEPLAALDAQRKEEILPFIERLPAEFGLPILYVTHAIEEVLRLASDLVLIERGRIVAAGPIEEVTSRLELHEYADRLDAGAVLRHHGDLHLGQTLHTPGGWVILDFEGEPARPLAERRVKQPALRDVAGMLRSLSYAAATRARSGPWTPGWEAAARAALLDGYLAGADRALLPAPGTPTGRLLTLLELEKALYELRYELGNRPDWVHLPLAGLRRIVDPNRSPR